MDPIKDIEVTSEEIVLEPTVIRPFTEEQIEAYAAKCGGRRNLREIEVATDDNEKFVYLVKRPSRALLQALAEEEQKGEKKSITTVQKLMLGCVLDGDKEAYEYDGAIYSELLKSIGSLVKSAKGDIKKL